MVSPSKGVSGRPRLVGGHERSAASTACHGRSFVYRDYPAHGRRDFRAELCKCLWCSLAQEREIQIAVRHPDVFRDPDRDIGPRQSFHVPDPVIPQGIVLGDLNQRGREAGMVLGGTSGRRAVPRIVIRQDKRVAHFTHVSGRQDGFSIICQHGRTAQGEI